jgi:hypothetical protein
VLYAVLLAFVVIIVWERFPEAEKALAAEAGHAASICRVSAGEDEGTGTLSQGLFLVEGSIETRSIP